MITDPRNLMQRLSFAFLLLLVFFIPVWINISILTIPFLLVTSIFSYSNKNFFQKLFSNRFALIIILFWLLHLFGVLYSSNWRYGLLDVQQKFSLLVFPLLFVLYSGSKTISTSKILNFFLLGSIVSAIVCLANAFYNSISYSESQLVFNPIPIDIPWENYFYYTRLSVVGHPSYISMYYTFSIVILFNLLRISNGIKYRILYVLGILFFSLLIFLLSSRAGLAVCFVTILIGLIGLLKNWKRIIVISSSLGVILIILLFSFYSKIPQLECIKDNILYKHSLRNLDNGKEDLRFGIWMCIPNIVSNSMLFGHGTGDSHEVLNREYLNQGLTYAAQESFNAHNQYLETLVALGLVGFIILILMLFYPLLFFFNKDDYFIIFSFLIIIIIHFLAESMLLRIRGVLFFSLFYGLFFCYKRNN